MNPIGSILRLAIAESFKSLRASKVRSGLTVTLIAIGLMSLVGVLTAIDAIQASVTSNLSQLGGASFDIIDKRASRRHGWLDDPATRPINFAQASTFRRLYPYSKEVTLSLRASFGAVATANGKKSNPNTVVMGADENYLNTYAYTLGEGRNFSTAEIKQARQVIIIGSELKDLLFPNGSAIGHRIVVLGKEWTVIGSLKKTAGTMGNNSGSRLLLMPLNQARTFQKTNGGYGLRVTTTAENLSNAQSIAERLMRRIRGDKPNRKASFEIERNESAIETVKSIGDSLRVGGSIIGFITLLGASIGLLNIMIVSVRERTREIGIRKSLGATTNAIRIQFLAEAIVICLVGAVLGIILGLGVGNLIPLITESGAFVLPIAWILLGFATAVVVGVISGIYPANAAAQVDPVESLRYE